MRKVLGILAVAGVAYLLYSKYQEIKKQKAKIKT